MKKIILLSLISNLLFANEITEVPNPNLSGESPFATKNTSMQNKNHIIRDNVAIFNGNDNNANIPNVNVETESYANPNYQNSYNNYQYPNEMNLDDEQIALMKSALRNQNLNAIQKRFLNKKYSGFENNIELIYEEGKTQKIRTRFAMATTLIFEVPIKSYILGDQTGFKVEEIPSMNNALSIKPLLIGIDTNLTIFTQDNKLHNFYLFSTDYRNKEDPYLIVKILDEDSKEILKNQQANEEKEYLIIQEGIAKLKIEKSKIQRGYAQKIKKENTWLMAEEIFNDEQWTYFKYDKKKNPKIPTIFAVIDKKDTPVETKIIGNYIIAETRNDKFSIWSGDSYVCVEKTKESQSDKPKNDKSEMKNTNSFEIKVKEREL